MMDKDENSSETKPTDQTAAEMKTTAAAAVSATDAGHQDGDHHPASGAVSVNGDAAVISEAAR